ncbi:MAG: hypothetical protein BHW45_05430 [Roseburia sp. CAG:197_41_10]|nr:MAG: hypothetical protein BHW45_05430 [Roseburia sp. CAG:197_41_10]
MRPEKLSEAIGMLPDEIIEETDAVRRNVRGSMKRKRRHRIYRYLSAAACLAILICVSFIWDGKKEGKTEHLDLPQISVGNNEAASYGFEGYLAHDVSELVNANPWNEQIELTTLPVYKNTVELEEFIPKNYDKEKVLEKIREVAGRLGIDEHALSQVKEQPEMETVTCETNEVSIQANAAGEISVEFQTPQDLPEGYVFNYDATYKDCLKAAEFFKNKYSDILSMKSPDERIINYNFRQTEFQQSEEGKLRKIWIHQPDLSQKVGDYPIISVAEAKTLLKKGNYSTSSPYQLPGMKYVKKVELVYLTDVLEAYFMPYYKFYVELPEEKEVTDSKGDTEMKTYGAYYVPAVESRYISNMPVYDGTFN